MNAPEGRVSSAAPELYRLAMAALVDVIEGRPPCAEATWLRSQSQQADSVEFAQWFISWNHIRHGIQRVDACRPRSGGLLLMELEDHNPYLSLDIVDDATRDRFVDAMKTSILQVL